MTRVKICGVTNLEDARVAVDAGADAIGFIFVENTPRFVTPELVAPIVRQLPPFVTPVGVFWNHPAGHVKAVAEACGLRALQFHGDETPDDLEGYTLPLIKTIKLPPVSTIDGMPEYRAKESFEAFGFQKVASAVLLDSTARWEEGAGRDPIEWTLAATIVTRLSGRPMLPRVILAAGLTPESVGRAVQTVKPYAVDVNSGVEARPGKKDADKVRRFIRAAREAA